jgi:hypothetical protein
MYRLSAEGIPAGLPSGDIIWEVIPPPPFNQVHRYDGYNSTVSFNHTGTHTLRMRWRNACGWSPDAVMNLPVSGPGWFSAVYPNPATDRLTIEINRDPANGSQSTESGDRADEITYDIRLYNLSGDLLRSMQTKGEQVELNVSTLPAGIYFLHIHDGISDTPEVHRIVVN